MASSTESAGRVALVTGASSGLGEAFARRLAKDGYDLVLVARRKERLDAIAADLKAAHGTNVEVLVADLSDDAQLAKVEERVRRAPVDMLVNNAGFMVAKDFAAGDVNVWDSLVRVRCLSTVRLTHAALGPMLERRRGDIINMASIAVYLPLPQHVVYSAVKRFILAFTESLSLEIHGSGVRIQALCPGWVETDLIADPAMDTSNISKSWRSQPDKVVDASLKALKRGKLIVVPGWRNKFLVFSVLTAYRPVLRWMMRKGKFNQAREIVPAPSSDGK